MKTKTLSLLKSLSSQDKSILVGNTIDHYDSALYGFLAPLLAPVFFPHHDPLVQLILAYSVLGTSLITRPLGAFIFGLIAKHHGPVYGLSSSLVGLSILTILLGCLPDYATGSWMAPLGLILIRMGKGIFASGESTIAKLFLMEGKDTQNAQRISHLYQTSSMAGIIFASGIATLLIAWNGPEIWRIGFWLGGLTGLVGVALRRTYKPGQKEKSQDLFLNFNWSTLLALWDYRPQVMRIAFVMGFSYLTYSIPFVFMNSFVPLVTDHTLETMMAMNTSLLVFDFFMIPILGKLTLRFDPFHVMVTASLVLAFTLMPLVQGIPNASLTYVTFVRVWIVFWGIIFMCPLNFWARGLFPQKDSYLLVGIGSALGAATIGRLSTPFCLWIWSLTHHPSMAVGGVALCMFLTAWAVHSGERKKVALNHPY